MIKRYFHNHIKRNFSIATIWINGGSDMDGNGKKGINQILCSLLTRGCEGFNNFALADFIESYGAELNHDVLEDGILISIKSLNAHFNKLFPLIDLIINKPILCKEQFKIIKRESLNTIKKDKENPFNLCFEKWRKIVYLKHPYAFNSNGYEKDVLRITYEDVLSEYENFKTRNKYLISNNLLKKGNYLEFIDKNISKEKLISKEYELNKELRFVSFPHKSNQTIIMLGNQTCSRINYDYLPLKVLESHLSFGMSSVLFKLFREDNGITYDVGVFNSFKKDNTPFLVYLSVSNKNALLAFELLTKLWKELLYSLINAEEIYLAKEKLKSYFLIKNQSLDDIQQRKIQLISYGMSADADEDYLTKTDEISPLVIQQITNKYFKKPFLSITGDKKICSEIKKKWILNF